jgi:hypothetical protein
MQQTWEVIFPAILHFTSSTYPIITLHSLPPIRIDRGEELPPETTASRCKT